MIFNQIAPKVETGYKVAFGEYLRKSGNTYYYSYPGDVPPIYVFGFYVYKSRIGITGNNSSPVYGPCALLWENPDRTTSGGKMQLTTLTVSGSIVSNQAWVSGVIESYDLLGNGEYAVDGNEFWFIPTSGSKWRFAPESFQIVYIY